MYVFSLDILVVVSQSLGVEPSAHAAKAESTLLVSSKSHFTLSVFPPPVAASLPPSPVLLEQLKERMNKQSSSKLVALSNTNRSSSSSGAQKSKMSLPGLTPRGGQHYAPPIGCRGGSVPRLSRPSRRSSACGLFLVLEAHPCSLCFCRDNSFSASEPPLPPSCEDPQLNPICKGLFALVREHTSWGLGCGHLQGRCDCS